MRINYDPEADAAYIRLTEQEPAHAVRSTSIELPDGVDGEVVLDWDDGRLFALEVLKASLLLPPDLLAQALPPGVRA
jgi:uncharacterized protein YuzE